MIAFDSVAVQQAGGGFNLLTPEEFFRLPLTERMRLVSEGKAQFVRDGKVISAKEALQARSDPKAA